MINFDKIPKAIKTILPDIPVFFELAPENQQYPYITYSIITDIPFSTFCQVYNKPIIQLSIHANLQVQDIFEINNTVMSTLDNYDDDEVRFIYLSTISLPRQKELPNISTFVQQYEVWER